jgi:hypothetical protein
MRPVEKRWQKASALAIDYCVLACPAFLITSFGVA